MPLTKNTIVLTAKIAAATLLAMVWSVVGMLLGDALMRALLFPGFIAAEVIVTLVPSWDERSTFMTLTLFANILILAVAAALWMAYRSTHRLPNSSDG